MPAASINPGDIVLVRPGERLAVDGLVIDGQSEIDQSLVTGETLPLSVATGASVYAGTLNLSGALRLKVTAAEQGTLLDEVARLLENASQSRSRYVRLADKAARLYSPLVHAAALATMLGWVALGASWHDAIITAIAVLIITCPCALGLAIPAVQVIAAGALFRSGVLLNSGDAIERLAKVDSVIFDKTGTLTLPEPEVVNAAEVPPEMLALAGRLALSSRHPLASSAGPCCKRQELPFPARSKNRAKASGSTSMARNCGSGVPLSVTPQMKRTVSRRWIRNLRRSRSHAVAEQFVFAVRQRLRADAVETIARPHPSGPRDRNPVR